MITPDATSRGVLWLRLFKPAACGLGAVAAAFLFLAWAGPGAAGEKPPAEPKPAATDGGPKDDDAVAERLWKDLEAMRPPGEPADWATHPPTTEQRQEFYKVQLEFACRASDLAADFVRRFPDHNNAPAAMNLERQWLAPFTSGVLEYRASRIEEDAARRYPGDEPARLAVVEKAAREMQGEFPREFVPLQLLLSVARRSGLEQARRLAAEVRDTKYVHDFVKEEAVELLRKLDAVGKPMTMEFTAVDGRKVDLRELKGKVVLIDFWATWCVPCVGELPAVKAVYEKFHPQGFEILGISFDENREALTQFLKAKEIPWPQFCDGKGWANEFGKRHGIGSIPTLWLVDRKGILRDLNARGALEPKVARLMSESP